MAVETVIGVVGPADVVDRIMRLGAGSGEWRLVAAPHGDESEAFERVSQISDSVDVVLFTGILQYDLARRRGEITVPVTYPHLSLSALSAAMLRGVLSGECDVARLSIDSFTEADARELYEGIGVPTDGVHVLEYASPESVDAFVDFHTKLYRAGKTTAAITTIGSVQRRLERSGVPVIRTVITSPILRAGLHSAAILGAGSRLQGSQLAVLLVEPVLAAQLVNGPGNYWQEELRLSVQRLLLAEVRRMSGTIRDFGLESFIVHTTYGALREVTDNFRHAPFLERINTDLGVAAALGIGFGATARDAEVHAQTALAQARQSGMSNACLIADDGEQITLPARGARAIRAPADDATNALSTTVLGTLVEKLGSTRDLPLVVDAGEVAAALGVTTRSARRTLHQMVSQGLAWPMPPERTANVGRPKQRYRLVDEKLAPRTG